MHADLRTYGATVPPAAEVAKTPPRGRKLVIAAAAAVSFCLGAGVAANVAPTSNLRRSAA